jgi:hypothetical protein
MANTLRIVFVEAALYCHEKSLNSEIDKASLHFDDLYQIILSFQTFEYAAQADIWKCFFKSICWKTNYHFVKNDRAWRWTQTPF